MYLSGIGVEDRLHDDEEVSDRPIACKPLKIDKPFGFDFIDSVPSKVAYPVNRAIEELQQFKQTSHLRMVKMQFLTDHNAPRNEIATASGRERDRALRNRAEQTYGKQRDGGT